jgi:hypothetical protein
LRRADALKVDQFELGPPVGNDDLEVVRMLEKTLPPPPILQFYRAHNGVRLLWNGTLGGTPLNGSVNIVPLLESSLRAPAQEDGEPLEGTLWNDEMDARVLAMLKRMAVFESIAGRSDYLTYLADETDARLFLVENDRLRPIVPDFDTAIGLLMHYAGADRLREHLTHTNWQHRLSADVVLQRITRL